MARRQELPFRPDCVCLTKLPVQIEFPSILLPPNISSGSIVDITVARNTASEAKSQASFLSLQDSIYQSFGAASPSPPILRCRNATQTSVVLEWGPIELATADVISLSLFRNGQKAGNIPRPLVMQSTKISGLAVDTEYTFHLVLRTTGGTFASDKVTIRTHKMTDLSGITVTPGILPAPLRESLAKAVERIGAKMADTVRIDTTHFVTTEGRGIAWEKAVELNIPVVRPEWIEGCERGGRIVGVRQYYLDADPRQRMVGMGQVTPGQQPTPTPPQKPSSPRTEAPLPDPPSDANGEYSNGVVGHESTSEPATEPKPEQKSEGGKAENEDNREQDEDNVAPVDEQKVRVEDREQHKVAIRPAERLPESAKSPGESKSPQDERTEGQSTAGEETFQEVAL